MPTSEQRKIYKKEWARNHKDLVRAAQRRTYAKHGHKYRARLKEKSILNREARRLYNKRYHHEYYLKNRASILAKSAAYAKSHPEIRRKCRSNYVTNSRAKYVARLKASNVRRKARMRGANVGCKLVSRIIQAWKSEPYFNCHYCGKRFPSSALAIDHVIAISRGGDHSCGNICKSCGPCNTRKRDRSVSEVMVKGQGFLI